MKLTTWLCLVLFVALTGCGSPIVGTWQATSTVQVLNPNGASVSQSLTTTLVFDELSWAIGGGCEVPMTYSGPRGTLKLKPWTCPLLTYDGLPFIQTTSASWKRTDLLEVRSADFEVVETDALEATFDFQIRTSETDPTFGPSVFFKQSPGQHFVRVK